MCEALLIFVLTCHPVINRAQIALTLAQSAMMAWDGTETSRVARIAHVEGWTTPAEADPISRVLIGSYPTWRRMAPIGFGVIIGSNLLANRMRKSHNWTRRIWWMPQVVSISSSAWGIHTGMEVR